MKFKRLKISLLISLLILLIPHLMLAQSTVKLYGTVIDEKTGKPLYRANVVIEATGFGASTNEWGFFQIENLLEGTYTVSASHIGYALQKYSDVRIPKDQPAHLNFKLRPIVIEMSEIEISADRWEEKLDANVYVIHQKDIAHANYQSVGEVLEHVPGVEIQNSGGIGGSKTISIRGSQTNQVLVLLDGIPLNDELGGEADLSKIPVNVIEKIEVHKGGGSPEFGSGAIGGVVNIITQKTFTNQAQLNSSYGSFQFFNFEPSLSGRFKNFGYFISYNYIENKGDFPYRYHDSRGNTIHENRINADIMSRNLFTRLNFVTGAHQIAAQAQRMESARGIPGKIDAWTAYARSNNVQDILGVEYGKKSRTFNITFNGRYSNSVTENSNLYPADAEKRFRRYSRWHYKYLISNYIFHSNIDYTPVDWFHLTMGYMGRLLHYQDENLMSSLEPPIHQADDLSHGLFIHQEWKTRLPWWHLQLIFTPTIRYDEMKIESENHKRFNQQWSPGAGLFLSAGNIYQFYLKSNISRSFRVPTFADLFYQDVRIEGKPDLAPEKSRNMDIGLGAKFTACGKMAGEITYFQYSVEDLIVWKLGSFEVFRPFNSDAEITGQEYSLEFTMPEDFITLGLGYTYLEPLNKSNNMTTRNKILPYRPQKSLKISLNVNYKQWHSSLHYRDVGKRYINEANTKEMPPYHILDVDLSWVFKIRLVELTGKFSIFNLLNEKYEIIRDMPLPQREWRLGLGIKI